MTYSCIFACYDMARNCIMPKTCTVSVLPSRTPHRFQAYNTRSLCPILATPGRGRHPPPPAAHRAPALLQHPKRMPVMTKDLFPTGSSPFLLCPQDNVALIAVLEAIEPGIPDTGTRRTLICVANTHIHANPELNDVKIWQVHTLLKGLEKIAAR